MATTVGGGQGRVRKDHSVIEIYIYIERESLQYYGFNSTAISHSSWRGYSIYDECYPTFVTFIFITNYGPGLGWVDSKLFYDGSKTSQIA
jgi:hypothetical protein